MSKLDELAAAVRVADASASEARKRVAQLNGQRDAAMRALEDSVRACEVARHNLFKGALEHA